MESRKRFCVNMFSVFLALSVFNCVHSFLEPSGQEPLDLNGGNNLPGVGDLVNEMMDEIKEFTDINGLEEISSCEKSLAFGGQRSRLLDTPEKIAKFESTLPEELQLLFAPIKAATAVLDMSLFTGKDMKHLLSYLGTEMSPTTFRNSLNPEQFLADPTKIAELVKNWTPAFRLLQKPTIMCQLNEKIPVKFFGILCQHLSSYDTSVKHMSIMEDRCAHCTAFYVKQRELKEMTNVLDGAKGRVLYKLIRKAFPSDWDMHMLRLSPGSVVVKDIGRIKPEHFSDRAQLDVLTNEEIWKNLKKKVMAKIAEALLTAFGPLNTWAKTDVTKFGQFIMALPLDRLEEILTPKLFFDIDPKLMDYPMSDKFFRIGVWKVVEYFEDPEKKPEFDSMTEQTGLICLISKYAPVESLFDSLITVADATKALVECPDFDESKLTFLLKKIINDEEFGWTGAELLEIDSLMPYLKTSMLDKIEDSELMTYWSKKSTTFDFPLTKAIMERLRDKFVLDDFTCTEMGNMKEGILTLTREELDTIPPSVFTDCTDRFFPYLGENCDYAPRTCDYIWELVHGQFEMVAMPMMDAIGDMTSDFVETFIPPDDMANIGANLDGLDGLKDIPMDDLQADALLDSMMKEFGEITSNFTDKRDALKLIGRGSSVKGLQGLLEEESLMNMLPEIASDVGKHGGKKSSVIYDKLHEELGLDRMTTDDVCIEEEMTDTYAAFFTQASESDLDKLLPESRKDILRSIGENKEYVQQMGREKVRSFFKTQYETNGWDRSESITLEDVEQMGPHLLCGITKDEAVKLEDDVVVHFIDTIEECDQLDQETRGELTGKFVEAKGGLKELLSSPTQLLQLKSLFPYVDVDIELTEKEKEKLKVLSEDIQSSFSERQERLEKRPSRDIPDEEREAEKSQRSIFNKKMARLASKDGEGLDCDSLLAFDGELDFIEEEDFKNMDLSEFNDCLEILHHTYWDDSQLEAIGSKLKQLYGGDTGSWPANATMRVGPLIKALDESDIGKMNFSPDVLAYFGHYNLGGEKASSILHKFVEDISIDDLSEITADILGSLGNLLCGFTEDEIAQMNSSAVLDASHGFALVDCFEEDQLEALMEKLENELGSDWSNFEPHKIEELGFLISGASEEILSSLGEEQLASIAGKTLEKIPPRKFAKAFDADTLQQLGLDQAMYLKPEHIWRMDKSQREAMGNFTRKTDFSVPKANHDGKEKSGSEEFQKARSLPRSSCGSTLAFAGQKDELLNTPDKVANFERSLGGDRLSFFKQLVESKDHSIAEFTEDEMRNTLEFLMEEVDEDDREDYMSILENFEYISSETLGYMMQEWPPKIHLLQKPEVMCGVISQLEVEPLRAFCERIAGEDASPAVTTEVVERCADCVVLRYNQREHYQHMSPLDDAKASVFMRKLRQLDVTWDLHVLALAPGALRPEDVELIKDDDFKNVDNLDIFHDEDVDCCLKDNVRRKIASKLHAALGPLSTWSEEVVDKVGHFVPFLPDSVLEKELTGVVALEHLELMKPEGEVTPEDKKTFTIASWNLAEHMIKIMSVKRLTEEELMKPFCLFAKFPPKEGIFTIYTMDQIKEGLRSCSDWNIDKEMSTRVLSKISQELNGTWEPEDIDLLHQFPSGVTPQLIEEIETRILQNKWRDINEAEYSMPVLRSLWNKLKSDFTLKSISCEGLKKMGKMFFALSLNELDSIPEIALGECMAHLSRVAGKACDEESRICATVWDKIGESTKQDVISEIDPGFVRFIPNDDFKKMSIDDLGGIDKIGEMELEPSQAEIVMEIVERENGPISKDNRNYTGRHLEKLGNVIYQGASAESLENMPRGTELLDSLSAMKRNRKSMRDEQVDAVSGTLFEMFGMNSGQTVCIDESTIKQSAWIFARANGDDLKKLDDVTKKSVLSELGKDGDSVNTMTRKLVREHFKALKEVENLDDKGRITEDDIDRFGPNLLCGMEKDDISKLSDQLVRENIVDLGGCDQLDQEARQELADKHVSASNGFSELLKKPEKLTELGNLWLHVELPDASTLSKDEKDIFRSVLDGVMSEVNERKERIEKRSDEDISSAEKTEEKVLRAEFARKIWEIVSDGADCSTIQSFGGDLEIITTDDISNFEPEVITDCLGEFQGTEWDRDQLAAFGEKLKLSFGDDTSTWDKDHVMRAGRLLGGLDDEDIDGLVLDEDIMSVLGEREVKEPGKMFEKFKEDAGITDMSTMDSNTLRGLGKMLCGMAASDMSDLEGDVIKESISDLGAIDCLDEKQRDILGEKYKDSITDDELKEMDLETMGNLVGGLGEEKLKKLDGEQLSRISPDAIKNMKPETIANAFTSEKMGKLTKDQVAALDPKVLRKLDVKQLIALENVVKSQKDVNATALALSKAEEYSIDLPDNVAVKSLDTFKEVRNLPSDNCGGVSFAGQAGNRLDTPTKRNVFDQTLPEDQSQIFSKIVASSDHDVSQFTTFEMRKMLEFLTNEMDESELNMLIDLKTEFAGLTPSDLSDTIQDVPPILYLLMKPTLMCSTLGEMTVDSLTFFCERLTNTDVTSATFIEVLNRCGDCLAVAHAHRTSETIIGMMDSFKGKAFYDKLRQWKTSNWDIYHLMFAPDSLEPSDIKYITNLDNFRDIAQIARLADPRFYEKASKPVLEMLARKLHEALESYSSWGFIESNMLLPYILNFPPKILKEEMKVTMVLSIMSNIEDIMEIASDKFMSIGAWKITDYLVKKADSVPKDIKEKVFCLVLKYTNHKKLWRRVYSTSDIFDFLPACKVYNIEEEKITNLIRIVVKSKNFKWDQEWFDALKEYIAAVPIYTLKKADPIFLYNNWAAVSDLDISFGKLDGLTCENIKDLGKVVLVLHSKDIDQIPVNAIGECASYIGGLLKDTCDRRKYICRTLWKKVKSFAKTNSKPLGSVVKDLGKGFLQHIPKKDIENLDIEDLGGVDSLSRLEPSENQAPVLMRKIKKMLGEVGKDNTNYSSEAVMKMGQTFYYGATSSEFEILPEDSSLLEMLPHMAKFYSNINEKKIEVVFKKLKKIFGVDSSSNICLDRAMAEQIGMFFTAASPADLRKFSDDTRKVIFQTIGSNIDYISKMSRVKIQDLFSVLMDTDSLGSKNIYEEEDIGLYKYLWCGQKSKQAERLSEEAVDGHMSMLKDCVHLEPDTRESLADRSISVSGTLSDLLTDNPKRLEDLGIMITAIDENLLKALPSDLKEVFLSSTQNLMEAVTAVQKEAKKRPSADISNDEKQKDEAKINSLGRTVFDMHVATAERRRKRSTPSVDCPTIRSFSGALSFLTAAEISAMESAEFQDCLAEFQSTTWDDTQLAAFQTQLTTGFGSDTSTWTQEHVLASGVLLDSLSEDQIKGLTVMDDDTVSSLGSNEFSKNAPYILETYMATESIDDLSSVNSDILGNVGNLVCGFDTAELAEMESETIDGATDDLGSVSCLNSDQLETLGNKIVEIRGTDWTEATTDDISSLGILAGGLPASVLEDIGTDQLASLSPEAMENMSPETFSNVFTAEKIASLSSAQANSLTEEHKAQLSPDQLSAVSAVATTTSDEESGASDHSSNLMTALIFVVLAYILQ